MNIVFFVIMLVSIYLISVNSPEKVMGAVLDGANGGLALSVKLFGVYALWLSILKIMEKAELDKALAKKLKKPIQYLFKDESPQTYKYLSLNLSANMLGMGGAATPMGIKSIESMKHHKNKVMLAVINSTSIQITPATIVALRASYNSASDIIIPSLIATFFTTFIGVLLVKALVK